MCFGCSKEPSQRTVSNLPMEFSTKLYNNVWRWSIVYIEGSQVIFQSKYCISSSQKINFVLANCRPWWNAALVCKSTKWMSIILAVLAAAFFTLDRQQSKMLVTKDERGSKSLETEFLIAICRQSVSYCFWPTFFDSIKVFDCRISAVILFSPMMTAL